MKQRIASYGMVIESRYPLGHGDAGLLNEPLFSRPAQNQLEQARQSVKNWLHKLKY